MSAQRGLWITDELPAGPVVCTSYPRLVDGFVHNLWSHCSKSMTNDRNIVFSVTSGGFRSSRAFARGRRLLLIALRPAWSAECGARRFPSFPQHYPQLRRPEANEVGRAWKPRGAARSGVRQHHGAILHIVHVRRGVTSQEDSELDHSRTLRGRGSAAPRTSWAAVAVVAVLIDRSAALRMRRCAYRTRSLAAN